MGILSTRWEGDYRDHKVVVSRNELTKGFSIEWDGQEIARRTWSWIGVGELRATQELDGTPAEVHVTIEWGGLNGKCTVLVDGTEVPVQLVK